ARGDHSYKVKKAVEYLHKNHPELKVDGDIQANFALNNELLKDKFPFSELVDIDVNTLIFPDLDSGNIAYKLLQEMTETETIGPILLGMKNSFHVLQLGSSVREIVNMVIIATLDAQRKEEKKEV
ncbi:MAG: phosphate acyltransferase, partial [Flavobacteriales bacterium]